MAIDVPGLPPLRWLEAVGRASVDDRGLSMIAHPGTDWFNDPTSATRIRTAPVLVFDPGDGHGAHPSGDDFLLSAEVTANLRYDFDAAVLFVHLGPDDYAKFCFERSPQGENTVVSVVTKGTSDDGNGRIIAGDRLGLRVARVGQALAFHFATIPVAPSDPAEPDHRFWHLARLFQLRPSKAPMVVGFSVQAPTGPGCYARFDDIRFQRATLGDFRDGT